MEQTASGRVNAVNASQQSKQAVDLAQFFNEHYLADDDTVAGDDCPKQNMPVFLNYGTNRLVLDVPLRIRKKHSFSKRTALERALENRLDFRTFFEWFRNQEDFENEQKSIKRDWDYRILRWSVCEKQPSQCWTMLKKSKCVGILSEWLSYAMIKNIA